jgi:hypothetical protein
MLNATQIAPLAAAAGFKRGTELETAVAVALAESGGRTDAVNRNSNGSTDTGLWQINSIHGYSSESLKDPATNARAARAIYLAAGSKWTPWVAYKNGRYLLFYGQAKSAGGALQTTPEPGRPSGPSLADAIPGATEAKAALDVANRVGAWTAKPANWLRVAYVMVGGMLLVGALLLVAVPAALNVTPAGKTLKAVKKLAA